LFPCAGVTGGVFPLPPDLVVDNADPPPPPLPPSIPFCVPPPPPPPAEVIVLKIELEPAAPFEPVGVKAVPPAPTVIGKPAAVTVILFPGVEYPSKGLAV
jgi:hypothetical protein